MAFENLSNKLQEVFKQLRSKGVLTEADVKAAMREVKIALLEADVNFKIVKEFIKKVTERAVGTEVLQGLNPGQQVIKIVNEEMIKLMGSETTEIAFRPGKELTVIMMVGLQRAPVLHYNVHPRESFRTHQRYSSQEQLSPELLWSRMYILQ